jgi:glycosyltransferase involved in cell wall biosynthesis
MLGDGESAILVAADNVEHLQSAIGWLLREPDSRVRLGRASRERMVERFLIDRTAQRVCEFWTMAIEQSGTLDPNPPRG